ncbi:MAG: hypothetical protein EA361_01695 [Bacteroidetes bacterium]|nr:MAG: hypothetical protein EA361_01695 [Bacteroidota bacterium]
MLERIENLNKQDFDRKYLNYLALFALIVIPLYTWLFGTKESPLDYTLSMIGNKMGYRINFILWGTFTGLLLTFFILRLYVLKSFHNPRARRLIIWSLLFLVLTVVIPAMEHLPILKKLHALAAVAFGITLSASLYMFIKFLHSINERVSIKSMWMLFTVIFGSILLFFLFGNTGIFELFFFFSITLFLIFLSKRVFRE